MFFCPYSRGVKPNVKTLADNNIELQRYRCRALQAEVLRRLEFYHRCMEHVVAEINQLCS